MRVFSLVLLVAAWPASWAFAKEAVHRMSDLQHQLDRGDEIELIDRTGRTLTGDVIEISPDAIRIRADGTEARIPEADIVLIRTAARDSLLNGLLIGLASGVGPVLPLAASCDLCDEAPVGQMLLGGVIWGGGLGLLIDFLRRDLQPVFRAGPAVPAVPAVRLTPIAAPGRAGAALSVTW